MFKKILLDNGLRLVYEKISYVRSVSVGIWVGTGSRNESVKNNGISHFIEHMLFKGTANRSAKEIAECIDAIGGQINAFTGKELTCYYGTTITEALPTLVELLSDMLAHSRFLDEDIRKEKRVICEEIDMYEDSAEDLVHEVLQQNIYKNQPLGFIISGTKTTVRSFTRLKLLDFMRQHYTASNIILSVAGNFEEESLLGQLNEAFSYLYASNTKAKAALLSLKQMKDKIALGPYEQKFRNKDEEKEPVYHSCFCIKHKENEQLHINIAYPSIPLDSKDSVVFAVFNSMFGGSNNSRLFQRIREELSLVYSIYSYGSSFERSGLFHIDITVNPQQALKVIKETRNVIDMFLNAGLTEEELLTHKAQVKTDLILGSESAKSRMNANAKSMLVRGYVKSLAEIIEELNEINVKRVYDFAKDILDHNNPSMCIVGTENNVSFMTLKKEFQKMYKEGIGYGL